MNDSPLKFARAFERLRSDLALEPDPVQRIVLIVNFRKTHENSLLRVPHWTYLLELIGKLYENVNKMNLQQLTIDELKELHKCLIALNEKSSGHIEPPNLKKNFDLVCLEYARKLFYAGEYEKALNLLNNNKLDLPDLEAIVGLNEFDQLYQIYSRYKETDSPLRSKLLDILTEWQGYRESLYQDQVLCLFVEKDRMGQMFRGQVKTLSARVEMFRKSSPTDEVTFDNQIKAPDDPFVGVAYEALIAVRRLFERHEFHHKAKRKYHAHFNIDSGNHQFTGDSIGLAIAMLTYTQLMKPEIMRHERFLSSDVAFTGSIDRDGNILAINDETVALKIERAFFSPIKYLIVPNSNLKPAKAYLNKLSDTYSNRKLILIGASTIYELIENRNIIRSEKVCVGQYAARKVIKYSRMTKLQTPLLLMLIYSLLIIIDTKTFAPWWFDWHIDHIEILGNKFRTVNTDGKTIWVSEEFESVLSVNDYSDTMGASFTNYMFYDIDKDNKDELFLIPKYINKGVHASKIYYFDDCGNHKWAKEAFKLTAYPGDKSYLDIDINPAYVTLKLYPIYDKDSSFYLLTISECSNPIRSQITLMNNHGDIVTGPYIQTGAIFKNFPIKQFDIDGDEYEELFICATNNRNNMAGLIILNPFNLAGVSPPYNDELFNLANMPKGSHSYYISFPETPISKGYNVRNYVRNVRKVSKNRFEVIIVEGVNVQIDNEVISQARAQELPNIVYVLDSNFIPVGIRLPDGNDVLINSLLLQLGKDRIYDFDKLCDSLLTEVVVYQGATKIHNVSNGIDFYLH